MLEAKKSAWFEKVFAAYNHNLFKRRFHSVRVSNLEFLRQRNSQIPLIVYANHSSWWDGLVAFEISRRTRLDSYVLMEEKQLKKLFLFRRIGAFSVVREKPREAAKSINYAVNLLREKPDRTIWVFPQGEILPNDARPIQFFNGISRIVEKLGKCFVAPVAMRYEFTGKFKPEIFVRIALPELISINKNFDSKHLTKHLTKRLTEILDNLKQDILTREIDTYEKIV